MIEPYNAVGLIPTFYGIRRRDDIEHNIEHLKSLTKAAFWFPISTSRCGSLPFPRAR